jgi:hypothetical protein
MVSSKYSSPNSNSFHLPQRGEVDIASDASNIGWGAIPMQRDLKIPHPLAKKFARDLPALGEVRVMLE